MRIRQTGQIRYRPLTAGELNADKSRNATHAVCRASYALVTKGFTGVCAQAHRHPQTDASDMATFIIPAFRDWTNVRRRFGLQKAVAGLAYRTMKRLVKLRINVLMSRPIAGIDALGIQSTVEGLEFRALASAEVRAFAADKIYELNDTMADRIDAGHDWCFASLAGDRLVNYSWYALGSIESLHCHVSLSFPADAVYMYKVFTHPDFRGAGVHQATFIHASRLLATLGLQRIVMFVEYANWDSLRSHVRLGFRTLGLVITAGSGRWYFERHPRVDKQLGLRFGAQADLSNRTAACDERSHSEPPCAVQQVRKTGFARLNEVGHCPAGALSPRQNCCNDLQGTAG